MLKASSVINNIVKYYMYFVFCIFSFSYFSWNLIPESGLFFISSLPIYVNGGLYYYQSYIQLITPSLYLDNMEVFILFFLLVFVMTLSILNYIHWFNYDKKDESTFIYVLSLKNSFSKLHSTFSISVFFINDFYVFDSILGGITEIFTFPYIILSFFLFFLLYVLYFIQIRAGFNFYRLLLLWECVFFFPTFFIFIFKLPFFFNYRSFVFCIYFGCFSFGKCNSCRVIYFLKLS